MRKEIDDLFEKSMWGGNSSAAVCTLSLLVEKALIPALAATNAEILKRVCPIDIDLTEQEAREVLDRILVELPSSGADVETKVSWVGLLDKFANVEYLRPALQFLRENHQRLDDQLAYSVLASINPQHFEGEDRQQVQSIVRASDLTEILVRLGDREDPHLNEAVFHMWGKIRAIGLPGECANIHCLKATVRFLAENWRTLRSDSVCGILTETPLECIEKAKDEQVRAILDEYNFIDVLARLENRTYNDWKNEIEKTCPDKLLPIIQQARSEEIWDRCDEERHHAKLRQTIKRVKESVKGMDWQKEEQ